MNDKYQEKALRKRRLIIIIVFGSAQRTSVSCWNTFLCIYKAEGIDGGYDRMT